jgi:osmotically-inducible protein OsmY
MQPDVSVSNPIQLAIRHALTDRIGPAAEAIDVCVEGEVVTLRGPVNSWSQREAVIDVAQDTAGVLEVKDCLHFRGYRTEW